MATMADIRAQLTGEGGMFEVVTEDVRGRPLQVYKTRMGSLREILTSAIGRGDDRTFISYGDTDWGYETFVRTANGIAHTLTRDYGINPGDRIAVLAQNCPEWCLAFWATVEIDSVLVGLNGWWKADEIMYGLNDSGARILVADRKRFERIADRLDETTHLEHVFLTDATPDDFPQAAQHTTLHHFEELTANPTADFPDIPIDEDDDAVIFYTSGTTGRPKGAVSTHRSMIANLQNTLFTALSGSMLAAANGQEGAAIQSDTVSLLTSPLFHVSGCHSGLVVGMVAGVKLVMPVGRFDAEHALQLIEQHRVTVWASIPTMVWRVCEHPDRHDYDTSTVGAVAFGGSPSADELQRLIAETFPNVRSTSNAYGLTETSSVATVLTGPDAKRKPWTVGTPVPTVELQIVDGNKPVGTGNVGEVCVRGPVLMKEYWGKPEATAEAIDEDGWLHTGDIGLLDDEGFLTITDRMKDMIIRGGENIYCVEIENRLVEHPGIADAAVIGVPHPELGEEVKAVIQTEPDAAITADDVRTWVADALANFKVPAHVELRTDPLPRNASGKLLKNVLRGEGEVSFVETM